ncbi:VCBS repeat-containing protein [Phenylobacterium montanum]|uniref:VCBS repeat-containing protein n=1 Tax=Phenylobacterium montanum TaxID=2823693 RepID=A0A975G202_9CAUL|nr:VCBS repeat-containing protein [Caulobacter sp. S6]QUD89093.1 VCBS repeat-containing protein [Caulobacter sp. S6]
MNIVIEYDSSANSAPAGFKTAVQYAVNYIDHLVLNPVTVPIMFGFGQIDGQNLASDALGESSNNGNIESYSSLVQLLTTAAKSEPAVLSLSALPATDPTNGGRFWVTDAQAAVYGLGSEPGYTDPVDGFVSLSSSASFTYDPNARVVSGSYDAIGVLVHEITEALGRTSDLGTGKFEGYTLYSEMDMFRYSSSGVHQLSNTAGYFSVDGHTMLLPYNDPSNGGDAGDWGNAVSGDAFGAFTPSAQQENLSLTDLQELNLLGFNVNWGASEDFSGFGLSDLLWRTGDGTVELGLSQTGVNLPNIQNHNLGQIGLNWTIQGVGDFNQDAKADLLWRNSAGQVVLWESNSGSGFTGSHDIDLGTIGSNWTIEAVGDFNGDGKADVLWLNTAGQLIGWVSNPGASFTGFTNQAFATVASNYQIHGIGDFSGDGRSDILWRTTEGDVQLWLNNTGSGSGFSHLDLGVVGSGWTIEGVGDFNGDGKADILWINTSGEMITWQSLAGSGFAGTSDTEIGFAGAGWSIIGVGDYNGDRKADIALRSSSGDVHIWTSNQGVGFSGFTVHDLGLVGADWHLF